MAAIDYRSTREWRRTRDRVLAEELCCALCGSTANPHVDHIIPVDAGGTHDRSNLRRLCRSCNTRLGARLANRRRRRGGMLRDGASGDHVAPALAGCTEPGSIFIGPLT